MGSRVDGGLFESVEPVDAVMASRVAEASLVEKMVQCASAGMAEARRNTKVNGQLSMMCWT